MIPRTNRNYAKFVFNLKKQILKRKLQATTGDLQSPRVPKKEKKVWNCIEERIQNKTEFGTTIRKIIFGDIYIDEISALSKKPFEDFTNLRVSLWWSFLELDGKEGDYLGLHILYVTYMYFQVGHKVWYYDKSGKIVDGSFICSSQNHKFDSKWMIVDLLQNENDLKYFCSSNNISFTTTFRYINRSKTTLEISQN